MNLTARRLLLSAFASTLLVIVAACASRPLSRIDANRALYESWPIEMQAAVLEGKAVAGMTPAMVEMALGKPSEISTRSSRTGEDEVWIYRKSSPGSGLLGNTNISLGGSIAGIGVQSGGGGRRSTSSGADEQDVVFRNGVVFRVE